LFYSVNFGKTLSSAGDLPTLQLKDAFTMPINILTFPLNLPLVNGRKLNGYDNIGLPSVVPFNIKYG